MAAHLLLPRESGELDGVIVMVAAKLLNPFLMLIFFLAIVSAVLSTIVSAVMAPAAVLAHNLIAPAWQTHRGQPLSQTSLLRLQRGAIAAVTALSAILAWSGEGAYELVMGSYSMALVSLFVPFVLGIHWKSLPPHAAWLAMGFGIGTWTLHFVNGWDMFLSPWLEPQGVEIPHELVGVLVSLIGLALGIGLAKLIHVPPTENIVEG
jgi:Na+/pantothenate symporter